MSVSGRVLVLDGDQAAALAVVRSLARRGLVVDVAAATERSLSALSKHRAEAFVHADPKSDPAAFVDDVRRRVAERDYELIIPVTDDTMQPLAEARATFREGLFAIPDDEALRATVEKDLTSEAAERAGVPFPRSSMVSTLTELERVAVDIGFPVVLKPRRSVTTGGDDIRASLHVRYAHGPDDLTRAAEALRYGPILVQEYCRGAGVGVEVLVDQGEVVHSFQHLRHHELPLTGGGSSLRESVPVDPVLLGDASRLMADIGYHGVAMVEFKLDPERGRRLMEINGRFWGSLPLCIAAGADFPWMLYRLLVHGERPDAPPARTGVFCRKLSREVFWLIEVLRRSDSDPMIRWPNRAGVLLEQLRVLLPGHHLDVQEFSDPRPGLVDFTRTWREVLRRYTERRAKLRIADDAERLRRGREVAERRLERARSVLFLCYGNINRSLVAGRLLDAAGRAVEVAAAGFHPREGRPADPTMREVAAARGLELDGAASRRVDDAMIDAADLVFVMEAGHALRLRAEFPRATGKTMLLGVFDPSSQRSVEIADPYGGDREDYEACFAQVDACVGELRSVLERAEGR